MVSHQEARSGISRNVTGFDDVHCTDDVYVQLNVIYRFVLIPCSLWRNSRSSSRDPFIQDLKNRVKPIVDEENMEDRSLLM